MTIKIGLDPGHGTDTAGKGVATMQEWEFNHAVARLASPIFQNNGFQVVMPQSIGGRDVPLEERTKRYNSENVKLIMSIHADWNADSSANGAWGFYWHTRNDSKRLADLWMKNLTTQTDIRNRGNRESVAGTWTNFHITRVPNAPSVLMEHGFMSNAADLKKLKSDEFRLSCAIAMVRAACEYFGVAFNGNVAEKATKSLPEAQNKPNTTSIGAQTEWSWSGRFTANTTIRVRRGVGLDASVVRYDSFIFKNQYVDFDRLYKADGYWWIRFKYPTNPSSGYFYMAVGLIQHGGQFKTSNTNGDLWGRVTNLSTNPSGSGTVRSGRFLANTTIKVRRNAPGLDSPVVRENSWIYDNQYVDFDRVYSKDGYWWIRFKYPTNPSSGYFYMAIGHKIRATSFETSNSKNYLWGRIL